MLDFADSTQVYISPGITDLRKSFNGLASIVKLQFKLDPYSKCMFVFCNRGHNLIKILQWDGSGLWLFMKRLDKSNFRWPTNASEVKLISTKELRWLLDGLSIEQKNAFKDRHPSIVI
jgi:transposase